MLGKIILFFVLGIGIFLSTGAAVLCTGFAGSAHGTPEWYMAYLAITQGIPIIVYFFSFCSLLLCILSDKNPNSSARTLGKAVIVYAASFAGIFLMAYLGLLKA